MHFLWCFAAVVFKYVHRYMSEVLRSADHWDVMDIYEQTRNLL